MLKIGGLINSSLVDYPGKISSVIFTRGCDFRCPFCHNHELVYSNGECLDFADVMESIEENRRWIDGIVITGGEPLLNTDIIEFAIYLKKRFALPVKVDTNGNNPNMLEKSIQAGVFDYFAMDLKTDLIQEKYDYITGRSVSLENIRSSINMIRNSKIPYQFRTTFIPGIHTHDDIRNIIEIIGKESNFVIQNFSNTKTLDPDFMKITPMTSDNFEKMKREIGI